MAIANYSINLDIAGNRTVPVNVFVSQYSDDFEIRCKLYSSQGALRMPGGASATIRGTKTDGHAFSETAQVSGDEIIVTGDKQMTAAPGKNHYEILIKNGSKTLYTATFVLVVKPSALDQDSFKSDSKIRELIGITANADDLIKAAKAVNDVMPTINKHTEEISSLSSKIDNVKDGSESTTVDGEMNAESENPVSNKAIMAFLNRYATNSDVHAWLLSYAKKSDIQQTGGESIDVDAELKEYMTNVKPSIKSAIISKGGTVADTDSFADYAQRITDIPNGVSAAETLPVQTTLTATPLSSVNGIKLNWQDVGANGYLIVRKLNTPPENSADGTIVYNGTYKADDGFVDTGARTGNVYYYRIFCRNSKNQYQSIEQGAIAKVDYKNRADQKTVGQLALGDTIKFGQWGNTKYTWKIIDTLDKTSGFVTMACDQYYGNGNLQYDTTENDKTTPNPIANRKNQGNNRWLYSNARQVLNSDGAANEWFVKQHQYDMNPNYANQNAFLHDWTDYEKNILMTKRNICGLDDADGGGSETTQDKIWFPSAFAMGLEISTVKEDDHVYEAYTDNNSRKFQSNFWLRTINNLGQGQTPNTASGVRCVSSAGSLGCITASNGYALRPFCLLPTSAYVRWSDSDNAYVFADDSQRNS